MRWSTYSRLTLGAATARFDVIAKKNVAVAKADMEDFDSAWNSVGVAVGTRSMDLYNEIEHHHQSGITDALRKPHSETTPVPADAKAMLPAGLAIRSSATALLLGTFVLAALPFEGQTPPFTCGFGSQATTSPPARQGYRVIKKTLLGGEGNWDYVTVDPDAHRKPACPMAAAALTASPTAESTYQVSGIRGGPGIGLIPGPEDVTS